MLNSFLERPPMCPLHHFKKQMWTAKGRGEKDTHTSAVFLSMLLLQKNPHIEKGVCTSRSDGDAKWEICQTNPGTLKSKSVSTFYDGIFWMMFINIITSQRACITEGGVNFWCVWVLTWLIACQRWVLLSPWGGGCNCSGILSGSFPLPTLKYLFLLYLGKDWTVENGPKQRDVVLYARYWVWGGRV